MVWLAALSAGWIGQAFGWWDPDVRLVRSDSIAWFSMASTQWAIAADQQQGVHVAWFDTRGGQVSEVYYKRSTNGGTTWGPDTPLTTGSQQWQESPGIACDSRGRLHVIYTEYFIGGSLYDDIHYKRSTDRGQTWEAQRTLVTVQGDFGGHTSVTTDGRDGVYLAFMNQTGAGWMQLDSYVRCSTDGGTTWAPTRRLTLTQDGYSPTVAADTLGRVHVVWTKGGGQVYYCRSTNRGSTWGPLTPISTGGSSQWNCSIASDQGNNLHVTWEDQRDGNREIYYLRSTDGGTTWGSDTRLTYNPSPSTYPNIVADPYGGVYIVYQDSADVTKGIWFLSSTNRGTTWTTETKISDKVFGAMAFPSLAVDPIRRLHVAWTDDEGFSQPGFHPSIWYKRGSLFSGIEDQAVQPAEGLSVSKLQLKASSPVSRTLALRYLLPQPGLAKLELYDALGRKVESLFEGQRAAGWHELRKPLDLPGGVYFVKLASGSQSLIQKVAVVR
jgi:hypothetical protein